MFNPINKIYLGSATPNNNSGGGVDPEPATTDYNDLLNKPSINNVSLTGNKTLDELGIQAKGEYLVEDDLTDINANIDNINEDITKIKSDIENSSQVISTNTQSISTNSESIANLTDELGNKAEKANTLEGYGIDNSYNKSEVDNLISMAETELESKIPTKVSQLTNDSNYTNKVYVDGEIAKIKQFSYTIVSTLPATGQANTIYLVNKTSGTTGDVYDEYMWINGKWELIGTTAVDLNGYATEEYVDDKVGAEATARENADNVLQSAIDSKANKATTLGGYNINDAYTKTETNNLLASKVDKITGKGLSTNDFTNEEKTKLDGIQAGAQVNKIETIAVNGTNQTITNKRVNITVPTTTSQLTNNSGYITSTQANKSYVSKTGYYPYSQEADEALSKVSRWSDYSTTLLSLAAANLFETPIDTDANNTVINDTLGRLLRITKAGNIGFFEMDLKYIGNISANNRVPVAEIPSDMRPLHKYTRIPAKIIVESNISVDAPLAVYIEINKEDSIIYLYNNLAFYASQYLGPRIMCSGSYVLGSMTI